MMAGLKILFPMCHLIGANMPNSKLFLSAAVLSVLLGVSSASAADLPARTYSKAPAMAPVYNWTGFYIFGGGGYGIWDANTDTRVGGTVLTIQRKNGGDGFFGTVGAGYDWQFNQSWVGGIFADGQFGSIRGTEENAFSNLSGTVKDRTNWAAGVRLGYLVTPTVLSYVNGGFTGAPFSSATFLSTGGAPPPPPPSLPLLGWFLRRRGGHQLCLFRLRTGGFL